MARLALAAPGVVMVALAVWGFWFFRLRATPTPVVIHNRTGSAITMYVNGVPARLLASERGCAGREDGDGDLAASLPPGASGWFCRVSRGIRTGSRLCYEARTADGSVLVAVQWGGDEWAAHGFALDVRPEGGPRECRVATADEAPG